MIRNRLTACKTELKPEFVLRSSANERHELKQIRKNTALNSNRSIAANGLDGPIPSSSCLWRCCHRIQLFQTARSFSVSHSTRIKQRQKVVLLLKYYGICLAPVRIVSVGRFKKSITARYMDCSNGCIDGYSWQIRNVFLQYYACDACVCSPCIAAFTGLVNRTTYVNHFQ